MLFIKILLLISFSFNITHAALEEIKTKQATTNLRYISSDGKYTYFTNKSGALKFSHNYNITTLISAEEFTNYSIVTDENQNWIAIEKMVNPHRKNWFFNDAEILISKLASTSTEFIGRGINARFHQQAKFLSFFKPHENEIHIVNLENKKKNYIIKLTNQKNPYFIPDVFMVTPNDVVYTDINSKGHAAVLLYSLFDKTFETIYKSSEISKKLELCIYQDAALIGEFPFNVLGKNSSITKVDLYNNLKFQNSTILYSSPFADIGNMVCFKDSIFFIKTKEYQRKIGFKKTDIAKFDLKSLQLKMISDKGDLLQLTRMGDMILTPYKGKLLVVEGENKILDDTIKGGKANE